VTALSIDQGVLDVERVRGALDLDCRLAQIPGRAQVRGFYFKQTADAVARRGRSAVAVYRRLSTLRSAWFFRMYSLRDYLEDAAAGAAAIDPNDPHAALRSIWRNAPRYARLFNAQRFLSLLQASPLDAMRWLQDQRDLFFNYGGIRVERRDDRYFVLHYFDEYIWIESAHRGGVEGLLTACNAIGSADVELDGPFDGRMHVRWQPR
jgi:uncharacterized protein (TIGR02265 family)